MDSEDENEDQAIDIEEVMKAKRDNPGMFVSAWEADENDIDGWSRNQIQADPAKQFIVAAENGDLSTINRLINEAKCSTFTSLQYLLSTKDRDGYTALHRACYGGHVHVLQRLLEVGAEVNSRTEDGWTPLHSAAFWNQLACVQLLISAGADLSAMTNSHQTPLHLAVANNQSPETLYLLMSMPNAPVYSVPNNTGDTVADVVERNTPYTDLSYPFSEAATCLFRKIPAKAN